MPGILCAVFLVFATGCAHLDIPVEVSGELVKAPDESMQQDAAEPEPEPLLASIAIGGLRVREGPGTAHKLAGMLYKGDPVSVMEVSSNGWCYVKGEEDVMGWVWGPYLEMPDGFDFIDREGIRYIRHTDDTLLGPDGRLMVYYMFRAPLERVVVNDVFGTRRIHPVNGGLGVRHEGMDLRAQEGTTIFAVSDGTVTAVAYHVSYGSFIDIEHHEGFSSRYAHLEQVLVKKGQKVMFGQKIALSGNSGRTTGPHLHFELRDNGKAVDPEEHIVMREIKVKKK